MAIAVAPAESKFLSLTFFVLFILAFPAHANRPLIACGHPDYPPFMWQEEDKIIGAGPEIAAAILKELCVELVSRYVGNWKRCQKEVKIGFVWKERTVEFNTWDDLIGKRTGTNLGGSMSKAFDAFILKYFKEHQVSNAVSSQLLKHYNWL